jgi:hypothetical protein
VLKNLLNSTARRRTNLEVLDWALLLQMAAAARVSFDVFFSTLLRAARIPGERLARV